MPQKGSLEGELAIRSLSFFFTHTYVGVGGAAVFGEGTRVTRPMDDGSMCSSDTMNELERKSTTGRERVVSRRTAQEIHIKMMHFWGGNGGGRWFEWFARGGKGRERLCAGETTS